MGLAGASGASSAGGSRKTGSATDSLRGRKVELPADALAFREQSDRIEKDIAAAGDAAWNAFLAATTPPTRFPRWT